MATDKLTNDLKKYAKEPVEVEQICATVYAFGSKIATLRLLFKYESSDQVRQGYSENLKTFYFCIDQS